jgi:hypothetical protein
LPAHHAPEGTDRNVRSEPRRGFIVPRILFSLGGVRSSCYRSELVPGSCLNSLGARPVSFLKLLLK